MTKPAKAFIFSATQTHEDPIPLMKAARSLLVAALPLLPLAQPAAAESISHGTLPAADPAVATTNTDLRQLEAALLETVPTLPPRALRGALSSWESLQARGAVSRPLLTLIDYSLPSKVKRMWVLDLAARRLLFHELVAHGRNSGEDLARSFSNEDGSHMTSLGAFVTGMAYDGRNGYSMRLRGMEPRLNDHAEARAIVVHGAPYVGEEVARKLGRLGRSHGCPALRPAIARTLIDEIKDGSVVYAWHPTIDEGGASGPLAQTISAPAGSATPSLAR